MNTITIQSLDLPTSDFRLPASWNDLNLQQQYACYQILFSDAPAWLDTHEIPTFKRFQLAQYLLNLTPKFLDAWRTDCEQAYGDWMATIIYLSEIEEILKATDGLFDITETEDGDKKYAVAFTLTRCPHPELSEAETITPSPHHPITLFAPADKLDNLNIYEIGLVFSLFENYLQSKDEAIADQLLSAVYRPSKPATPENELMDYEGDRRIRYVDSSVPKRTEYIRQLPPLTRQLLLFWIASCRQHIVQDNPDVFRQPEEEAEPNRFGWASVIMSMAGSVTDLERVSNTSYKDVFLYLSYLEEQRIKAERERMIAQSR